MTGLVATALERAQAFLLAPAPVARDAAAGRASLRITVGVVGLRRACGASTVARGLACAFEMQDPGGGELVREIEPEELPRTQVDVTVLVAPGDGEPALATVVAGLLSSRLGHAVVVVANRVRDGQSWAGHAAACLPDSRLAAMLVARGRLPPGELGTALHALVSNLVAPSSAW